MPFGYLNLFFESLSPLAGENWGEKNVPSPGFEPGSMP